MKQLQKIVHNDPKMRNNLITKNESRNLPNQYMFHKPSGIALKGIMQDYPPLKSTQNQLQWMIHQYCQ